MFLGYAECHHKGRVCVCVLPWSPRRVAVCASAAGGSARSSWAGTERSRCRCPSLCRSATLTHAHTRVGKTGTRVARLAAHRWCVRLSLTGSLRLNFDWQLTHKLQRQLNHFLEGEEKQSKTKINTNRNLLSGASPSILSFRFPSKIVVTFVVVFLYFSSYLCFQLVFVNCL